MFRFLIGVACGAALAYYMDAERGSSRRAQTSEWLRQYINSDTIEQARQTTMSQARNLGQQISQQAGVVSDRVNQYRSRRESAGRTTIPDTESAVNSATASANA
jgi:gas vesicle protein